jgi:hypothetical protein
MRKTKRIVHVKSHIGVGCEHCLAMFDEDGFKNAVNHYIEKHGYTLFHVGTESEHDSEGRLFYYTVAVLGKFEGEKPAKTKIDFT